MSQPSVMLIGTNASPTYVNLYVVCKRFSFSFLKRKIGSIPWSILQGPYARLGISGYLSQTEALAVNSKPTYDICDSKSVKSAP